MKIDAACFGVPGPVHSEPLSDTNLPWVVDGATIAKHFDIPRVKLINDLEAMAHGILLLWPAGRNRNPQRRNPSNAITRRSPDRGGNRTGRIHPLLERLALSTYSSEGGHADFAPNMTMKLNCCATCGSNYLHVSYERVLSGPVSMPSMTMSATAKKNEPTWLSEQIKAGDPAAVIAEAGSRGRQTSPSRHSIYLPPSMEPKRAILPSKP